MQVLKEKLGKKRTLLNDDQRRRLAVKVKVAQPESAGRDHNDRHARYAPPLAPTARCGEVGLFGTSSEGGQAAGE